LNRSPARPRAITEAVSSVLFAPEDLSVVRGDPGGRRRYLDELLVARTPRMAGVLGDYDKTLRQRNGLLKSARGMRGGVDAGALEAWDERLVATGTAVVEARDALVADLAPLVAEQYRVVAGADQEVGLATVLSIDGDAPAADLPVAERFVAALADVRRRELERGITLVGPHRDDLLLTLNELPARITASHGESWSLALALRLGEAELLRLDSPNGDPVVILDDVFAELDERRRSRLAEQAARYEQVLITAAVEGDVPAALQGGVTRIRAGEVLTA
jgi:DNA replication and repair protein RecF